MGSIISGLMGGFGRKPDKPRTEQRSQISRSTSAKEEPKAKAAAKIALIKTGSKQGVLGESTGGRKKLLGN